MSCSAFGPASLSRRRSTGSRRTSLLRGWTAAALAGALTLPVASAADCDDLGHCEMPAWNPVGSLSLDEVGREIAMFDDVAAVGAPGARQVHVYVLDSGNWTHEDTLVPPGGSSAGGFGFALDVTETQILVGSPEDDTFGPSAGAVFVYERAGNTWNFSEKLTATVPAAFERFGASLDRDGALTCIGGPGALPGGVVHVFLQLGLWWELATLQEPGTGAFGVDVAFEESTLLVGDPADGTLGVNAGAVYYYDVTIVATSFPQKILMPGGTADDYFGSTVALAGPHAVMGSYGDDDFGPESGSAWIYRFVPAAAPVAAHWVPLDKLTACDATANARFGFNVAASLSRILVGAPLDDGIGAAYVFHRDTTSPTGWSDEGKLVAIGGVPGDALGIAGDIEGDYPLLGAPGADGADIDSGTALMYSLAGTTAGGGACTCTSVAMDIEVGVGKPGTPGIPTLSGLAPPVLGEEASIVAGNALPGAPAYLVLGFVSGSLPFDAGTLYMLDPIFIALPPVPGGGSFALPYVLPNDPMLCGVPLVHQVLVVDPGAIGPHNTAQTNGLLRILGS